MLHLLSIEDVRFELTPEIKITLSIQSFLVTYLKGLALKLKWVY